MNLVNRQGDTESLMHLGAVFLVLLTDLLKKFLQEKQTEVAPYNLKNMNNKIVKLYRLYISTLKVFLLVTGRSVSTNTADQPGPSGLNKEKDQSRPTPSWSVSAHLQSQVKVEHL